MTEYARYNKARKNYITAKSNQEEDISDSNFIF